METDRKTEGKVVKVARLPHDGKTAIVQIDGCIMTKECVVSSRMGKEDFFKAFSDCRNKDLEDLRKRAGDKQWMFTTLMGSMFEEWLCGLLRPLVERCADADGLTISELRKEDASTDPTEWMDMLWMKLLNRATPFIAGVEDKPEDRHEDKPEDRPDVKSPLFALPCGCSLTRHRATRRTKFIGTAVRHDPDGQPFEKMCEVDVDLDAHTAHVIYDGQHIGEVRMDRGDKRVLERAGRYVLRSFLENLAKSDRHAANLKARKAEAVKESEAEA